MPKILVVEDDTLVRALAVDLLAELGHTTEEAGSAAEAMAKAQGAGPFDGVVLDMGLPDLTGDKVVASMRGIFPDLPILVASGASPQDLRAQFASDLKVGVVGKPYTLDTLDRALKAIGVAGTPL